MRNSGDDGWHDHILTVTSVLSGVSIPIAYTVLLSSGVELVNILLLLLVIYVILDNWYGLREDLKRVAKAHVYINGRWEVWLHILAVVSFSCLPYLIAAGQQAIGQPKKADITPVSLLLNLAAFCFFDAWRKLVALWEFRKVIRRDRGEWGELWRKLPNEDRRWPGEYLLYVVSGFFWFLVLLGEFFALNSNQLEQSYKSLLVIVSWGIIRAIDLLAIPRLRTWVSEWIFHIAGKSQPPSDLPPNQGGGSRA